MNSDTRGGNRAGSLEYLLLHQRASPIIKLSSNSLGRLITALPIAGIFCSPPDSAPAICRRRNEMLILVTPIQQLLERELSHYHCYTSKV